MNERLLRYLLESCPQINARIAKDWIESVCHESKAIILDTGEKLSKSILESKIEKQVKWHIKRLNGIGGSEMSVLYLEYKGGFHPNGVSARDVIANKLCLETPGPTNGDMERGKETEIFARRKFEAKFKNLIPYNEAYEALKKLNENGGVINHPWMKSAPDGIYICIETDDKVLVDFKTPASQDVFEEMTINTPDHYKAQIAQYKYNLKVAGIDINRTMLVPFSTKEWDVGVNEFTVTDDLTNDILAAGDFYWQHVLNNELPVRPRSENYQYIQELPRGFRECASDFILTKRRMSMDKSQDDKNKIKLLKLASISGVNWDVPDTKTGIGGINITTKGKKYVDSKALSSARKENADKYELEMKQYHVKLQSLVGKVVQSSDIPSLPSLEEVNEEDFVTIKNQVTVSVARGKKHPNAGFVKEIESIAERSIQYAREDMMECNNFDISLDEIKGMINDPNSSFFNKPEAIDVFNEIGFTVKNEPTSEKSSEEENLDMIF